MYKMKRRFYSTPHCFFDPLISKMSMARRRLSTCLDLTRSNALDERTRGIERTGWRDLQAPFFWRATRLRYNRTTRKKFTVER